MNSIINLVTPISHLFEDDNNAKIILENSDFLECRDRSFRNSSPKQILFHCDFQPIHKLSDKVFHYLEKIKKTKKDLSLISFHIASSCDRPKLDNGMFQVGGNNYSENEMYMNAEDNFKIINKIFGDEVELAVENNNYYPTSAYNYVTEPHFIKAIAENSNLKVLFDIAHAKVTSINKKISFDSYRDSLPLERVIQLHICQHGIRNDGLAYDAHEIPSDDLFDEVKKYVNTLPNLKYLTIEYYKDVHNLIPILNKFNKLKYDEKNTIKQY